MGPTLDQLRAKHAWDVVQEVKKRLNNDEMEKFKDQAKKLPVRIMTAGLGPALAFLEAKKYAPELVRALDGWTSQRIPPSNNQNNLLKRIVEGNADFLRRATDETLAYLQWLNRFTEADGFTDDNVRQE